MREFRIDRLACGFPARTLLEDISFSVRAGDFFCLLGPNGVGKTTLFKTLLRLIKPKGGRILIDGEDVAGWTHRQFAAHVGYVPQAHMPSFPFLARDVVAMGRTSRLGLLGAPSRADLRIAEEALDFLSIGHLKNVACTEISGGERQLVLIARALTQQPDILLMDEPTSNLDFGNQIAVLELVAQLAEEKAIGVVMTTHDPNQALLYASQAGAIGRGGTFDVGAPENVVSEAYLRDTYGVAPQRGETRLDDGRRVNVFLPIARQQARAPSRLWRDALAALLVGLAFFVGAGGESARGRGVA